MSWLGSIFAGDEELGKKNDDHRPLNGAPRPSWSPRKPASAWRTRRILYGICALLLIYVFVENIPTDLGPSSRYTHGAQDGRGGKAQGEPRDLFRDNSIDKPRRPEIPSEAEERYFDGPIKFYMLATSLYAGARLGGQQELNKNVLFAASSLKSASEIIPMACEMARWERNNVHFALMGRDSMDIEEIKKINGAEEDCNIHWHDARPDYSRWSSDYRMEVSVTAAMDNIHTFIHPQIIIIDDPGREDGFFVSALRSKAMGLGKGIIELPNDATETMMWLTRLDSGSLAAWTATYIDILIQAPPESSASLVRLLKSIENADYFGIRRPHLTIELPTDVDPPTWRYLENLVWPPLDWSGRPHASQVTLRHRVKRRTSTEHEASARLVESFYPVRTANSHVLLLSPQVELSSLYYHYVMYHLLEYKYSAFGASTTAFPNLMGFSLELPLYHLNDTEPLDPPTLKRTPFKGKEKALPGERTPFLWQAPNANAALYFGDKWMEFHSFLSARLTKPPTSRRKVFTEKHPSWREFLLELFRARGYSMLYPNLPIDGDAIVTVHDELYQLPEEYAKPSTNPAIPPPDLDPSKPITVDNDTNPRSPPPNTEHKILESDLISLLPGDGDLPGVSNLPLLSYNGIQISNKISHEAATSFAETYRREVGTCETIEETTPRAANSALDLFCHLDDIYDPLKPIPFELPLSGREMYDADAITSEHHANAKEETLSHLARQGGQPLPVKPAPIPPVQQHSEKDSSSEAQDEFQSQMQRQAKHKAKHVDGGAVPAQDKSETKEGAKEPLQSKEDVTKQPPLGAVEDPKADAGQEKGNGW